MLKSALIAFASLWLATGAIACAFHSYVPRETLVDRLSGSAALVLARPDPSNPFRFSVVAPVSGSVADPVIPHLVDSVTLRRLMQSEETYVLFAQDADTQAWDRVAFVDTQMSEVLAYTMPRLPDWAEPGNPGRVQFFGTMIEDENIAIQRLALREIDQADYATLKSLELAPDPRWLIARMHTASEADLLPIRVLLLGFTTSDAASERLRTGLARVAPVSSVLVGAYATAFIEHAGEAAVREIAQNYLANPALPSQSKELLFEAMAIHASTSDNAAVVDAINTTVTAALHDDEGEASAMVARQFGARQVWAHADRLTEALRQMRIQAPGDMIEVAMYVAGAKAAEQDSVN